MTIHKYRKGNNMLECQFVIIKIKKNTGIHNTFIKYKDSEIGFKYFNVDNINCDNISRCLILLCDDKNITELYWCSCEIEITHLKKCIVCKILYSSSSDIVIKNAVDSIFLDINKDFNESYVTIELSKGLYNQFERIIEDYSYNKITREYESKDSSDAVGKLSQKNEYCKRQYDLKDPTLDNRGEFQRDYDRIIYSKAYRRLVDKTQVFSSSKGDHYRTRMTHTMIVCQIARSICNALHANQSLTGAIAIGHDLGHTPFGHIGERTLNKIILEKEPNVGGFKHNYQGIRVVSKLEKTYYEIDGLDLSYQVIEGIFKHTSQKDYVDINAFVRDQSLKDYLNLDYKFSVTLEGQIVAIADEIAQRSHDIDDAFSSNLLSIDEFLEYLKLKKFEGLKEEIDTILERHNKFKESIIIDDNDLFATQISSAIVKYFINDVVDASKIKILKYENDNIDDFNEKHYLTENVVCFSEDGLLICNYLEKMLNNKVLNSTEVSVSDQNASIIIKSLFEVYYENPRLLHNGTKEKIYHDFLRERNSSGKINNIIDLINGSSYAIKDEFDCIKKHPNDEYKEKHIILVRNICDYISGMTDSYAIAEYNKICKSN